MPTIKCTCILVAIDPQLIAIATKFLTTGALMKLAEPEFFIGNDMKNRKWHHKITKIKLYLMDKIVIISIEFGPSRRIL